MIIFVCPKCLGTHIHRFENRIAKTGNDWFICRRCKHKFPLELTDYREEYDCFAE